MTKQFQHLNNKECKRLLNLLWKNENLFDGTLGTWNTTPVYLELRGYAKSFYLQPYLVTRVHEAMFRK